MKIHPLINKKSSHYINENGEHEIFKMQEIFKDCELESWCKLNEYKYKIRLGKKQGEQESDNLKKQRTFKYSKMLYELSSFNDYLCDNLSEIVQEIKHGILDEDKAKAFLNGEIKIKSQKYWHDLAIELVKYMLEEE